MPSFEEIHSRDVSGKTYAQQSPGVLQEAQLLKQESGELLSRTGMLTRSIYLLTTFISLIFLLWTFTKGFDYTDEGMYLLAAQHPNDINVSNTMFFIVTSFLYKISLKNIVFFRIVGLLILLFSSCILFVGITKYIRLISNQDKLPQDIDIFFITINGTLLYYVLLPTPSYNLLNVSIIYAGIGILLMSLASQISFNDSSRSIMTPTLLGFIVALDLFFKFPSAIVLFLIISSVFLLKRKFSELLFFYIGSGFSLLIYFLFIRSFASWKKLFFDGIQATVQLGGEPVIGTLKINLNQILSGFKNSIFNVIPVLVFLALWRILPIRWRHSYSNILLLFILFTFPYLIIHFRLYQGGAWPKIPAETILSFLIVSSTIYLLTALKFNKLMNFNTLFFIIILISIPFIGAIGTSVPIMGGIIECLTPWGIGVFLLNYNLSTYLKSNLYNLLTAFLMIVITSQIITSMIFFPYRLNSGMLEQNVQISVGNPSTMLKIDLKEAQFLNSLRDIINKNKIAKNEKYLMAFCDMPGFVFFLGKRSPGFPWFFGLVKNYNTFILEHAKQSLIRRSIIITNPLMNNCMPDLKNFGIDFPKGYDHIGHLKYPRFWWNVNKKMIPIDIWIPIQSG